jgi:hypothetical protein
MTAYQDAFPDFAAADMPAIPEGFEDTSWGNDCCPSFSRTVGKFTLTIWVDFADRDQREYPGADRFGLYREDHNASLEDEGDARLPLYEGNDWASLLAALEAYLADSGASTVPHQTTAQNLTADLTAFCAREGLTPASADEMLLEAGLTRPQRQWLTAFCLYWEANTRRAGFWSVG